MCVGQTRCSAFTSEVSKEVKVCEIFWIARPELIYFYDRRFLMSTNMPIQGTTRTNGTALPTAAAAAELSQRNTRKLLGSCG